MHEYHSCVELDSYMYWEVFCMNYAGIQCNLMATIIN
jgi:hypothetical protein